MSWSAGKPLLVMLVLAVTSAAWVAARPDAPRGDLVLWVFAASHARAYRQPIAPGRPSLVEQYQRETGRSVDVRLIANAALNLRLNGILDRGGGGDTPDLVEIEISSIGRYFRPRLDLIGLLPLNELLRRDGWLEKLIASRLAPWTRSGVIFGVPHDVHPVTITYRKDLFDEAGVDLASAATWEQFQQLCLRYQRYWESRGRRNVRAIELPATASGYLVVMLLQQRINVIDEQSRPQLDDPRIARTLAFYARCVAGPDAIGTEVTPGPQGANIDLRQGTLAALITPDWRSGYLAIEAPDLAGKMAMMPLPRFSPTDAPTSTWGGTMMAIVRPSKQHDAAWDLLQWLYLRPEALEARVAHTGILPPVRSAYADPIWHRPDPYFGGQRVGELHIALAEQVPRRVVTPFTALAEQQLTFVLHRAVSHVRSGAPGDLESLCRQWLAERQADLERRIRFARFEP